MGICQATITITIPSASPRPVLAAAWLPAARPGMLHRGIHTGDTVVSLIPGTVPDIIHKWVIMRYRMSTAPKMVCVQV